MKKIITFIMLILLPLFASPVFSKEITFIQATDIHLKNDATYLKEFVDKVNKMQHIDFVLFSGDNIDVSNKESLDLFLKTIKDIKFKKYVFIGNHDVYKAQNLCKEQYMKEVQKYLGKYHSAEPHYVFKVDKTVFLVADGTKEVIPGANGYFRSKELDWIDKNLTKYKNNKVVILQHYPLIDTHIKGHSLYKKEEYIEMLKKHDNVIAIVAGHYHENKEENINGVYNILTPAFEKGTYKVINVEEDNDYMIFTSLVEPNEE